MRTLLLICATLVSLWVTASPAIAAPGNDITMAAGFPKCNPAVPQNLYTFHTKGTITTAAGWQLTEIKSSYDKLINGVFVESGFMTGSLNNNTTWDHEFGNFTPGVGDLIKVKATWSKGGQVVSMTLVYTISIQNNQYVFTQQ